jgi:hypothetical protein
MRFKVVLLLLICLCSTASFASSQADTQQLSRAQRVWEDAILAKGGRERLESVRSIFISSRSKYWHGLKRYEVFTEELNVFPGKMWSWEDYRPDVFGLTVELYDFDKGIKYITNSDVPAPQPHAIPPYETVLFRTYGLLGYLMETKWLKPKVTGLNESSLRRRKVDIVHTVLTDHVEGFSPENIYIDFWIDRETHLPLKVTYTLTKLGQRGSPTDIGFPEYVDINGIKVPSKTEIDGVRDSVVVQLNVSYNEELFSRPPLIAAGPEAWKPRARQ